MTTTFTDYVSSGLQVLGRALLHREVVPVRDIRTVKYGFESQGRRTLRSITTLNDPKGNLYLVEIPARKDCTVSVQVVDPGKRFRLLDGNGVPFFDEDLESLLLRRKSGSQLVLPRGYRERAAFRDEAKRFAVSLIFNG